MFQKAIKVIGTATVQIYQPRTRKVWGRNVPCIPIFIANGVILKIEDQQIIFGRHISNLHDFEMHFYSLVIQVLIDSGGENQGYCMFVLRIENYLISCGVDEAIHVFRSHKIEQNHKQKTSHESNRENLYLLCIYLYLCVFSMRRIESDVIQSIEKIITSSHSKTKPKRETVPTRNATPEIHKEWKEMHTVRQRKPMLSKSYTQIKHLQNQRAKMYEEMAEVRDFKVTNPRSEYLVYKSPRKPIYERVDIILRNREAKMEKIRQEVSNTNRLKQEKEKEICRGSIHYNKTLPTNQLERKGKEMFEQGESRQQRMNEMKLAYMKQEAKLQRDKPLISQTSNKIYGRLVEKKKLDTHLLNRFAQYDIKHTEEREEVHKKVALQYYPFKPTITLSDDSTALLQQKILNHTQSHAHCSSCRWLGA